MQDDKCKNVEIKKTKRQNNVKKLEENTSKTFLHLYAESLQHYSSSRSFLSRRVEPSYFFRREIRGIKLRRCGTSKNVVGVGLRLSLSLSRNRLFLGWRGSSVPSEMSEYLMCVCVCVCVCGEIFAWCERTRNCLTDTKKRTRTFLYAERTIHALLRVACVSQAKRKFDVIFSSMSRKMEAKQWVASRGAGASEGGTKVTKVHENFLSHTKWCEIIHWTRFMYSRDWTSAAAAVANMSEVDGGMCNGVPWLATTPMEPSYLCHVQWLTTIYVRRSAWSRFI